MIKRIAGIWAAFSIVLWPFGDGYTACAAEVSQGAEELSPIYVDSADELIDTARELDMVSLEEAEKSDSEYSLRRIVLFSDEKPEESYGASDIICYERYDYYVFTFDTEADTSCAYSEMKEDFGDDCMLDTVMYADDMLAEYEIPYNATSWGTKYMGMDTLKNEASDYNVDTAVDVAVLDTGANENHVLLSGRIDKEHSTCVVTDQDSSDISDSLGHGSHVAGIIADATPENVRLTIIKCFTDDGTTSGMNVYNAIISAIDADVDIINMSFCFYGSNITEATKGKINTLIQSAVDHNILMCVAAGNANNGGTPVDVEGNSYPADADGVVTVSALKKKYGTTEDGSMIAPDTVEFDNSYSYYGNKVDFSAPGTAVSSAGLNALNAVKSGTSMATPHISAAAAYVKMAEEGLTNEEVVERLASFSVDLGAEGKDELYGYGCPYMAEYFEKLSGGELPPAPVIEANPVTLKSAANVTSGIKLTWDKVGAAESYRIYRKEINSPYKLIDTIQGNELFSYIDTQVTPGTFYRYGVKAVKDGKAGAAANTIITIRLKTPNVASKNVNGGIKVAWSNTKGATGYKVYKKKNGSSWSLYKTFAGDVTSFVDTNTTSGITYTYTVKAARSAVNSYYKTAGSTSWRIADVALSSVKANGGGSVTVSWKVEKSLSGYELQRSYSSSFTDIKAVKLPVNVLTRNMKYLQKGKVCYVRIRGYMKSDGSVLYGAWSQVYKVKVQ